VPIYANQDLVAQSDEMEGWNTPLNRRASFHNLHRIIRYGFSVRAPDVLKLTSCIDARIAELSRQWSYFGANSLCMNSMRLILPLTRRIQLCLSPRP